MKTFSVAALLAVATCVQAVEYEPEHPGYCPAFDEWESFDTDEYNEMPATCKLAAIWNKVKENSTMNRFFIGTEFNSFFDSNWNLTFDTVSDTMPEKQVKKLYPRGVVSQAKFVAAPDTPFTGCYKGWDHGIVRIAEFVSTTPENPKTAPGVEVKCLRDTMSSGNVVAAFAIDGQPSFNYFKNRYSTMLDEPRNKCNRATIGRKFAEAT